MKIAVIAALLISVFAAPFIYTAMAQDPAPEAAPAPQAATQVAKPAKLAPETVLATVGETKITAGEIQEILDASPQPVPAEQWSMARDYFRDQLIIRELLEQYVEAQNIECTDEELAAEKQELAKFAEAQGMSVEEFIKANDLTDEKLEKAIRTRKALEQHVTEDKVKAFVEANPDYFDGTKVEASHILIAVPYSASTKDQKEAKAKIEKIAKDIEAGEIEFAEAAKKFSDDNQGPEGGSASRGGALGDPFAFPQMVPQFAQAAFALKPGQTSNVIRTQFGFHLILVTDREDGKGDSTATQPTQEQIQVAERTLQAKVEQEVTGMAMDIPVVIHEVE